MKRLDALMHAPWPVLAPPLALGIAELRTRVEVLGREM